MASEMTAYFLMIPCFVVCGCVFQNVSIGKILFMI
jgi:hypothetical protein